MKEDTGGREVTKENDVAWAIVMFLRELRGWRKESRQLNQLINAIEWTNATKKRGDKRPANQGMSGWDTREASTTAKMSTIDQ